MAGISKFQRISVAVAGLALALVVMACGGVAKKPTTIPQVAGTYAGELTVVSPVIDPPMKFATTAVVTQSEADVEINLTVTIDEETRTRPPALTGTVDKDGKLTFTGVVVLSFSDDICGTRTLESLGGSFKDDELRFEHTTSTEKCGTVTSTLTASKE